MIDSFLLLAPVLLLAVVSLLAFIGCDLVFPLKAFELKHLKRTNCGGPPQVDVDLGWDDDSDPNAANTPNKGFILTNTGSAVIDPANGQAAGAIYETCRFGNPGMSYKYAVGKGTFTVILKFAQISDNASLQGAFAFAIDGGGAQVIQENAFDVVQKAGASRTKFDYTNGQVAVNEAGLLTITFSQAQNQGNFPFVNAIEVDETVEV